MPKGREQRGIERKIDTKQITLHQKCDSASGRLYKKCNLQTRHDEKAHDGMAHFEPFDIRQSESCDLPGVGLPIPFFRPLILHAHLAKGKID
jgi:hypothetical protein